MRGDDVIVILTSVGTEQQALDIGEALVRRRYATCVNLVPSTRSIYRWRGKVCEDSEFLLIIKTLAREYGAVAHTIHEINSYELPEILSFGIRAFGVAFLFVVIRKLFVRQGCLGIVLQVELEFLFIEVCRRSWNS